MLDTKARAALDALPPAVKRRLLKEIAQAAEKAFRRGFQHGHLAARGEMRGEAPTAKAVADGRSSPLTACVHPPGTGGGRAKLLDRLRYELSRSRQPLLADRLANVK